MPSASCSVYAVFERDFYTFTYTDLSGNNGLTAWYENRVNDSPDAVAEKVYFTHINHETGYRDIQERFAPYAESAYDGLELEVEDE